MDSMDSMWKRAIELRSRITKNGDEMYEARNKVDLSLAYIESDMKELHSHTLAIEEKLSLQKKALKEKAELVICLDKYLEVCFELQNAESEVEQAHQKLKGKNKDRKTSSDVKSCTLEGRLMFQVKRLLRSYWKREELSKDEHKRIVQSVADEIIAKERETGAILPLSNSAITQILAKNFSDIESKVQAEIEKLNKRKRMEGP